MLRVVVDDWRRRLQFSRLGRNAGCGLVAGSLVNRGKNDGPRPEKQSRVKTANEQGPQQQSSAHSTHPPGCRWLEGFESLRSRPAPCPLDFHQNIRLVFFIDEGKVPVLA